MRIKKFITAKKLPYLILLLTIIFNLWLYWPELFIKSDPNDNIFQFALIDQVDRVWEESAQFCPDNRVSCFVFRVSYLFDHWVPQWAQGYPLPFYYSHLPQIAIVASYRILKFIFSQLSIYFYFNLIKYLVLCFLPISFFLAGKNFGFSPLASSLAALFAANLSTDGLYGIDLASYLWRGFGLSSQLLAVFFLPLAVSYVFKVLQSARHPELNSGSQREKMPKQVRHDANWLSPDIIKPILFLWLTAEAHLGIGLIAFLSGLVFLLIDFKPKNILKRLGRLTLIYLITGFFLSYHLLPFIYYNQYHNVSFWDPIWKFESFGLQEVSKMLLAGELFDFGRPSLLTAFLLIGFFTTLTVNSSRMALALLFPFWLALFFGASTWGPLMKIIPIIKSFHQHRFLVGVQLIGVFLAAIGAERLMGLISERATSKVSAGFKKAHGLLVPLFVILLLIPLSQQTIRYGQHNTRLIKSANHRFNQDWPDFERVFKTLSRLPKARVYAGRPGNWGREFKVGDTQTYMALSVHGFPILGFLPETWSHNSDTEQFFDEGNLAHYELYNIGYVVAPEEVTFPEFVVPLEKFGKYHLYQVQTSGYFMLGTKNISIFSKKSDFANLAHLWLASSLVNQRSFPSLSFEKRGKTDVSVTDEVTYTRDSSSDLPKSLNIFADEPFKTASSSPSGRIFEEKVDSQRYEVQVNVDDPCPDCLLIFKMTYHPNWQFSLDGKKVSQQIFFPFFQGIEISPGEHKIVASYQPNKLRVALLILELFTLFGAVLFYFSKVKSP